MSIEVVQSSSVSSLQNSSPTHIIRNDGLYQHNNNNNNNNNTHDLNIINITPSLSPVATLHTNTQQEQEQEQEQEEVGSGGERKRRREEEQEQEERDYQLKLFGLFFTVFKRSVFGCSSCEIKTSVFSSSSSSSSAAAAAASCGMEIGLPTNVRHVAHVTFDRFNGFLGLPVEFEPEVPRRAPSASTTVFGVSTNSMQLSFDTRGNSVPTILLLMQHRLYALGGLQAEGIFRINPDNGREEFVRDQLNRGLIPDDVDVHCLAGLIKAWFRELPTGVLDCLSAEQVMESQTEEECFQLARLLPPTEAALLDWAVNLMADVAQFEHMNKMNARNVAMVFAPNMTHMADPLTALMHAVQVMNFLKTLIERTLKEREDSVLDSALDSYSRDPSGDHGCHTTPLQTIDEENNESEPDVGEVHSSKNMNPTAADHDTSIENINIQGEENQSSASNHKEESTPEAIKVKPPNKQKSCRSGQTSTMKKGTRNSNEKLVQVSKSAEKTKGSILVNSMNLRRERIEAWR